jgi:hypothetical protein
MSKILSFLLIILIPLFSYSQDLSGLWVGTLSNDSTKEVLKYEVLIQKDGKNYTAFSQTWFVINNETYYGIKKMKTWVAKDQKIILADEMLIANNYPLQVNKKLKQLNVLDFRLNNGETIMTGDFETNTTKEFRSLTGMVHLKKQAVPYNSSLVNFLKERSLSSPLVMGK